MGAVVDVDEALGRLDGIEEERSRIDTELNALDGRQADLDKQYERLSAKREALVDSRDRADAEYTELYGALDELAAEPSVEIAALDPAVPRAVVPALTVRASLSESQAFVPPIPPGSVWESGEVPALPDPLPSPVLATAAQPPPARWKLWAGIGGGVFVVLMIIGISVSPEEAPPTTNKADGVAVPASGADPVADPAAALLGAVGEALAPADEPAASPKKRPKKRRRKRASKKSQKSGKKSRAKKSGGNKRRKKSGGK